jgi:hypothetical protein
VLEKLRKYEILKRDGGLRILLTKSFRGHSQPYASSDLPAVRVLSSSYANPGKVMVKFVCYSCCQWPGMDSASRASPLKSFIWAKRDGPAVAGVPTESVLGIHTKSGEQTIIAADYIL